MSPMNPPVFLTFTGADCIEDLPGMVELHHLYPIEWGILFSRSRTGDPRYPGREVVAEFARAGLNLAAHLCGAYSRDIMAGRFPAIAANPFWFCRMQVNHSEPDPSAIQKVLDPLAMPAVAQWNGAGEWPTDRRVFWLFDGSGGRGIVPDAWPSHPGRMVGYAGGLGPSNACAVAAAISERHQARLAYWLDMESGIRTHDWFDLEKCRQVCESVYGRRGAFTTGDRDPAAARQRGAADGSQPDRPRVP